MGAGRATGSTRVAGAIVVLLITFASPPPGSAQEAPVRDAPGRGKAFLLSLLVPGLGHRYASQDGWDGSASLFLAADAALWVGLVAATMRQDHLETAYTTLASSRAGAVVAGKDREFFLNLGSFRSSDEYLEVQLRNRAWDQIRYVEDRTFQWTWQSDADFLRYQELQEDAESMRRRRPTIIALLVGNRLLSGILAVRAAGRADAGGAALELSLGQLSQAPDRPAIRIRARL